METVENRGFFPAKSCAFPESPLIGEKISNTTTYCVYCLDSPTGQVIRIVVGEQKAKMDRAAPPVHFVPTDKFLAPDSRPAVERASRPAHRGRPVFLFPIPCFYAAAPKTQARKLSFIPRTLHTRKDHPKAVLARAMIDAQVCSPGKETAVSKDYWWHSHQ